MTGVELKSRINADVKAALIAKESERLTTLRMFLAAIKQREVDERITLDEPAILSVLDKMIKQRKESAVEFEKANRSDLQEKELREIVILQHFLPAQLNDSEIDALLADAIRESNPQGMKDMSKVMAILKPKIQGRCDMGKVSQLIKKKLGG